MFFYFDKSSFKDSLDKNPNLQKFFIDEADVEKQKFEEEEKIPYVDLFAQEDEDPIVGTNTALDGKTLETYAQEKGLCYAAADGVYGGIRSLINLAAIPAYKATTFCTEGEWGDFETDAQKVFNETLPEEVPPTTAGESIVQGISKFATTTALAGGVGKSVGLTGETGKLTQLTLKTIAKNKEGLAVGKILAPAINGMIGDATAFWQDKENLSTIINNNIDNPYIKAISDWLAIKEDDDVADRMLKQALEGLFTNAAVSGIFNILKGVKNYGKQVIANARLKEQGTRLAEDILEMQAEKSIKADVGEGKQKMVKAIVKDEDGKIVQKLVPEKELKRELNEEAKKLGINIPRNPEKISIEQAQKSVKQRIIDLGWGDAETLTEEQLKKLSTDANNMVERVIPYLDKEEAVFFDNLMKIKQTGVDLAQGIITKEERNQHFVEALEKIADQFGKTQDALYDAGKTLGYASTRQTHKDIKEILIAIKENADELTKDRMFDIFSSAQTIDELRSKLIKLGYIDKKYFNKNPIKNVFTQFTALEQAGLMSSPSTIMRNIVTSLEMAVEQIGTKITTSFVSGGKREIRRMFGLGAPVSGVEMKEAYTTFSAYSDAIVDALGWFAQKVSGKNPGSSFTSRYRNSASRQAMTNLPKEIGMTFKQDGFFNNILNKYVTYSGVNASEKIDNFFESVFFRGEARSRAWEYASRVGRRDGLSEQQIKELAENISDRVLGVDLTRQRELVKQTEDVLADDLVVYSIARKSREEAAKMTFRSGRGPITNGISEMLNTAWFLRPIIPFFKTGSTIFFDRFLGDLTPVGWLSKWLSPEFRAMMKKGGREADEYWGKMILGGGVMTAGYLLAVNGKITGDYSDDPQVRAAQIAAGYQPNSYVFDHDDGTKGYLSLNYLGPLSLALKYPAKILSVIADYRNKLKLPDEDYKISEVLTALAVSFASEMADEAALRNFADGYNLFIRSKNEKEVLEKLEEGAIRTGANLVPRGIGEVVSGAKYLIDSEAIKQGTDEWLDEFKKKLGISTFDKYDVFGNKIKDKNPLLNFLGAKYISQDENESWYDSLIDDGIGFEMPRKSIVINKQRIEINDRQAEGIKQQMKILGAEQSIKRLAEDTKKLSKTDRKQQIQKVFDAFRENAIIMYYMKDADLQEEYKNEIKRIPKLHELRVDQVPSMRIK